MLTRRVHLLIDDERYGRISDEAQRRKCSVAEVVREAIDTAFPPRWPDRATAGAAILDAEPMEVPDPATLREELDALRGRAG